jgi:4-hydroxy-3-methylbut-2-enyl diphosphate reductase
MEVVLAQPRGFCAGVSRAIEIVQRALAIHGSPVYVYHEIVHNSHVVQDLARQGAIFVDDIIEIPPGACTVFSAHGVGIGVVEKARHRGLRVIDATCPLVAKVHQQVQRYAREKYSIIVIGHAGHDEVVGTLGAVDMPMHLVQSVADVERLKLPDTDKVAYVTQTTLSPDDVACIIAALERRFPGIVGPRTDDICYATQNRQAAVRRMAPGVDMMLVIGARNSSNSSRLREVAEQQGVPAYLIEDASELDPAWCSGAHRVGLTAGASVPDYLVDEVQQRLRGLGATRITQFPGPQESVSFRLPLAELKALAR